MEVTNIDVIFYILAAIFFLLDGVTVSVNRISWTPLGFLALTLSLIF